VGDAEEGEEKRLKSEVRSVSVSELQSLSIESLVRGPADRLKPAAWLPSELLENGIRIGAASDQLRANFPGWNADALRETIAMVVAFEAVAEEAEAFGRAVRYTLGLMRQRAMEGVLAMVKVAEPLSRRPDGKHLAPLITEFKKVRAKYRGSRKSTPKQAQTRTTSGSRRSGGGRRARLARRRHVHRAER
jgi:hypothetical protein